MTSSIQAPFEKRRGGIERQRSVQGRNHRVEGRFPFTNPITGAGESVVAVNFPVWFIDKPSMSFGGELDINEVLIDGAFPTLSALVKTWTTQVRDGATYYVGANLLVVSSGAPNQRMFVHWQMEGKALVNPLLQPHNTDDAI